MHKGLSRSILDGQLPTRHDQVTMEGLLATLQLPVSLEILAITSSFSPLGNPLYRRPVSR